MADIYEHSETQTKASYYLLALPTSRPANAKPLAAHLCQCNLDKMSM